MKYTVLAVAFLLFAVRAEAKDHSVHLHIENIGSDPVGWHFSLYFGKNKEIEKTLETAVEAYYGIPLPSLPPIGPSVFNKIEHQDDDNGRMPAGTTFDKTFTVSGPGIFLLDFSDWADHAHIKVKLEIDNQTFFEGEGSADNIDNWGKKHHYLKRNGQTASTPTPSEPVHYGGTARKTDDREIAMYLD